MLERWRETAAVKQHPAGALIHLASRLTRKVPHLHVHPHLIRLPGGLSGRRGDRVQALELSESGKRHMSYIVKVTYNKILISLAFLLSVERK